MTSSDGSPVILVHRAAVATPSSTSLVARIASIAEGMTVMSDETPSDEELWNISNIAWRATGLSTLHEAQTVANRALFNAGRASVTPPTEPALREWADHEVGDGTAPPEENFWDDRTTPLASSEHEGEEAPWGPATTA